MPLYVSFNEYDFMKKNSLTILLSAALCFAQSPAFPQQALTTGDSFQDIPVKRILNSNSTTASFSTLKDKLTIVDFFGTWCVPCLKALPQLDQIKNAFKEDVSIVLVSNETEEQLSRFINKRQPFSFPVIVDKGNSWNNLFQPPSLPYTVVIKDGKVIAITEAGKITADAVLSWLHASAINPGTVKHTETKTSPMVTNKKSGNEAVSLSQKFIYAAKTGEPIAGVSSQLASMPYQNLLNRLKTDNKKKAFWINLYNGYTLAALKSAPEQYKNRSAFFGRKSIEVAGETMSLDDIEHGILRHSKIKWSLGHLNKLFPSKKEKELRAEMLDYRIHFALNCGAKSCPPIAFYNDETLDAQLDLATKAYLTGEAEYDSVANVVHVPKLMSWFRADFGGRKGMRKILRAQGIIPQEGSPKITFKEYDWNLYLANYQKTN